MSKKILLLLACIYLLAVPVFSQYYNFRPERQTNRLYSTDIINGTGGFLSFNDPIPFTSTTYWNNPDYDQPKYVENLIRIGIVNNDDVVSAFKYEISLQIDYYVAGQSSPASTETIVIPISYDPDSLKSYNDLSVYKGEKYLGFQATVIGIVNVTGSTPYPQARSAVAKNFYIETEVVVHHYTYTTTNPPFYVHTSSTSDNKFLTVKWYVDDNSNNTSCGTGINVIVPSDFELEWTYIDDYLFNLSTGTASNYLSSGNTIKYSFKNNSTKIRLKDFTYKIPLIYDRGAIIYRVRGIRPDRQDAREFYYSSWSFDMLESNTVSKTHSCFEGFGYVITSGHGNEKLNWQYNIGFAEDGKYKHVINYYDGILKNRQTQTKVNTDQNYVVAVDKIYDYEGRLSIQTLPVPVLQTNVDFRRDLLLKASDNSPYKAADFDEIGCSQPTQIPELGSLSMAHIYYSPLNTDKAGLQKYVPDAKGYPFIHTVVSPDNSDILWQGGAGKELQLWNGHAAKYDYSRSTQPEINTLFGTEIGRAEFYGKRIATDQNTQVTVSISNSRGQTVASALSGAPDYESHPISLLSNYVAGQPRVFNILGSQTQDINYNKVSIQNVYYNEGQGWNKIKYKLSFPRFPAEHVGSAGSYLEAKAFYSFGIYNDCGTLVVPEPDDVADASGELGAYQVSTSEYTSEYNPANSIQAFLSPGKYIAGKELIFKPWEIKDQVVIPFIYQHDDITEAPKSYRNEHNFVRASIESRDFPCIDSGSFESPCDMKKRKMMDELYPGGKYGMYNKTPAGAYQNAPANSILARARYQCGCTGDPIYIENCFIRYVWDKGYRYRSNTCISWPNSLSKNGRTYFNIKDLPIDTFIYIFNDEIAEALLPMHPEFCKLAICDDGGYPEKLQKINTFPEALTAGRSTLYDIITNDPLYIKAASSSPGFSAYSASIMYDLLKQFKNTSQPLDQLALSILYCGAGNSFEAYHCANFGPYAGSITSSSVLPELQEQFFQLLKSYYVTNRAMVLQKILDETGANCAPCQTGVAEIPVGSEQDYNPAWCDPRPAIGRLYLEPPAVFPSIFDNQNPDQLDPNLPLIPGWLRDMFNAASSVPQGTVNPPPATGVLDVMEEDKCDVIVKGIIKNLRNCTINNNDPADLSNLEGDLMSICASQGAAGFTPYSIETAMSNAGFVKDDLCNSFLVEYDLLGDKNDRPFRYACPSTDMKQHIAAFLQRSDVIACMKDASPGGGSTPTFNLDGPNNLFEDKIAAFLSTSTNTDAVEIQGFTETYANPLNPLEVYTYIKLRLRYYDVLLNKSYYTSFYIGKQKADDDSYNPNGADDVMINEVDCINDYPTAIKDGRQTRYTAVIRHMSVLNNSLNPPQKDGNYYFWSYDIPFMDAVDDPAMLNCITCQDIRNALMGFESAASYYGYNTNFNHPLYEVTLENYLNHHFNTITGITRRKFYYNSYLELMKGCAVTDYIKVNTTPATIKLNYQGLGMYTDIENFINTLNLISGRRLVTLWTANLFDHNLYIDLNGVPRDSIFIYKKFIENNKGTGIFTWLPSESLAIFTSLSHDVNALSSFGTFSSTHVTLPPINGSDSRDMTQHKFAGTLGALGQAELFQAVSSYLDTCSSCFAVYNGELLRSSDYNNPEKRDYLDYIYNLPMQPNDRTSFINEVMPEKLQEAIGAFTSKIVSYDDPFCGKYRKDLYMSEPDQSSHPGYELLTNTILQEVNNVANGPFPDEIKMAISAPSLYLYRKANGNYWYRYFDANDKAHNVYIIPPDNGLDVSSYELDDPAIELIPCDGDIYRFNLLVHHPDNPSDILKCPGYTDFPIGYSQRLQHVVLQENPEGSLCIDSIDCEWIEMADARNHGRVMYRDYFDSLANSVTDTMLRFLVRNTHEELILEMQEQKYHYTLYYYDLAGNLVRTVPPSGVQLLGENTFQYVDRSRSVDSALIAPVHQKISKYRYNAQNQVVYQETPDGGVTHFFYDLYGRLTFSQNSKQRTDGYYSYILYDAQSRIVETGEAQFGCVLAPSSSVFDYTTCSYGGGNAVHPPWVESNGEVAISTIVQKVLESKRNNVVHTFYDAPATGVDLEAIASATNSAYPTLAAQEFLRNRVAAIYHYNTLAANESATGSIEPSFATHYSYDMMGNVKTLVQDYPAMKDVKQRYKKIDYDFDQISGKVLMVSYNRGRPDQFYHKYEYDADNRITEVNTSPDGLIWTKDARYSYYKHGPLASTKIGDKLIQSMEYAYTIQGWLKAINGEMLRTDKTMGEGGTGSPDAAYARDAIALSLDYYLNDYKDITNSGTTAVNNFAALDKSLYNGNIVRQSVAVAGLGDIQRSYTYDQLNRLKTASNATVNEANLAVTPTQLYNSTYSYDPDGNLTGLQRYGSAASLMDDFTYNYPANNANNRLKNVQDAVNNGSTGPDIKNGQALENYKYDKIGNLTDDGQNRQHMDWNNLGKLQQIRDTAKDHYIYYTYDGQGNRVSKNIIKGKGTADEKHNGEYYVRDATGNIMATYQFGRKLVSGVMTEDTLALTEHHIYGSNRLGVQNYDKFQLMNTYHASAPITGLSVAKPWYSYYTDEIVHSSKKLPFPNGTIPSLEKFTVQRYLGKRHYELSDHLGNVLATTLDRRTGHKPNPSATSYDYYHADLASVQDYYPFGMPMPGRTLQAGDIGRYQFGFNGQLKDDEVAGGGNRLDFGERIYESRLGRFISVDPLTKQFPYYAPYQFAGNMPIWAKDLDGLEPGIDPTGLTYGMSDALTRKVMTERGHTPGEIQTYIENINNAAAIGTLAGTVAGAAAVLTPQLISAAVANPSIATEITVAALAGVAGYDGDLPGPYDDIGRGARGFFKLVDNGVESSSGLRWINLRKYRIGEESSIHHVFRHTKDDLGKKLHGVFDKTGSDLINQIDEAFNVANSKPWNKNLKSETIDNVTRSVRQNGDIDYTVNMGTRIGYEGGKQGTGQALEKIRIGTTGDNEVKTIFPTK